jgi:hypothetical protein
VATHKSAAVNWAVTAGPISHSPLPIDMPRMIAPAPVTRTAFGGGAGSFATSHGAACRLRRLGGALDGQRYSCGHVLSALRA